MRAYSRDLRERIVKTAVETGASSQEIAIRFDVSLFSVRRYIIASKNGNLKPVKRKSWPKKIDPAILLQDVEKYPDATLLERAGKFGASTTAIWKRLAAMNITRKKKILDYSERDELDRWFFERALADIKKKHPVCYIDETGIDHRLFRECAWSKRGVCVRERVLGHRGDRTSVIAGLFNGKLVSPMVYSSNCDIDRFNLFLYHLIKIIPKGAVIVLDNASFHKHEFSRQLARDAGCSLLFLPAYSPDFNPIEHTWAKIKAWLRKGFRFVSNKARLIASFCDRLARNQRDC